MKNENELIEKLISLTKRRGFIYPGSEIYGGLAGTWDYGPAGVALKDNIKSAWWRAMVGERDDVVGIDAAILMHPRVWEASGHTEAFSDPLVECKLCHERIRADQRDLIEEHEESHKKRHEKPEWTEPRQFNLLMQTFVGPVEEERRPTYLRGEITQGVHVNFRNVLDSNPMRLPFGIAQIGKAFRNEITPGHYTFRSREFEQMELQYFVRPDEKESKKIFDYWKETRMRWYRDLGIRKANLRFREHGPGERAHYARYAWDIEYNSAWGWKEFEGIHHRGDWDLSRHMKYSGKDLTYYDDEKKERFIPWVIETSGGVDRALLFFLMDAYREEKIDAEIRVWLELHPRLAPVKVAVFPLLANKPKLVEKAHSIYQSLKPHLAVAWDDIGNIGKRYRRQDEIGTPWCVTVDFQTLEDDTVTVRDRDTMKQDRMKVGDLTAWFTERLK